MRLNNLQAMMLFQTLRDSCVIADTANIFTFNAQQRRDLAEAIMNQQSKDLVDLDISEHLIPLNSDAASLDDVAKEQGANNES